MKQSQIYRRAAERIFDFRSYYTCTAIHKVHAVLEDRIRARMQYRQLFGPAYHSSEWLGLYYGTEHQRSYEVRILMLLLMSEIAKDEE